MAYIKDPFRLEQRRDRLAKKQNLKILRGIYSKKLPEIKNINTGSFWDSHFRANFDRKKEHMSNDREYLVYQCVRKIPGNFLDVGFGRGGLERLLAEDKDINIYCMDISSVAVKKAKRSLRGEFKKGSVLNIPFQNEFFDIVVALELMEHIPPSKTFKAFGELKRVLKVGGALLVSVPLNEGLEEMVKKCISPSGHVRVYTPELISAELKIAGFKIKENTFKLPP